MLLLSIYIYCQVFCDLYSGLRSWCLTPLSTIFLLYRGCQFYSWRKPEYPETPTDLSQVTSLWTGFVLSTLVVIGTDGLGSYKSFEVLLTVSCPIFPSILIAKNLLTGSLKNRLIDNLETQKKSISMKNSQFFDYLL